MPLPLEGAYAEVARALEGYRVLAEQTVAATTRGRPAPSRAAAQPPPAEMRRVMRELIEAYAARPIAIRGAPGTHPSGPSYDALFGYLADGGRDFLAVTREMRADIKARLSQELGNADAIPLRAEFEQVVEEAVRARVLARLEGRIRDTRIRALSPAYARAKRAAGFSGPPGVRTRALLESVAKLRVEVK